MSCWLEYVVAHLVESCTGIKEVVTRFAGCWTGVAEYQSFRLENLVAQLV